MSPEPVYILGAGMHPWGKWGHNFVEYGIDAASTALADAGVEWREIQFVAALPRTETVKLQRFKLRQM